MGTSRPFLLLLPVISSLREVIGGSWKSLRSGQVGGDHDGAPLVALAEDLEEEFRAGGGQGDEAQFVDDQQCEGGQLPL